MPEPLEEEPVADFAEPIIRQHCQTQKENRRYPPEPLAEAADPDAVVTADAAAEALEAPVATAPEVPVAVKNKELMQAC